MTKPHRRSLSFGIAIATVALLAALGTSSSTARADWGPGAYGASPFLTFTTLTLQNGWTGGPFNTALPQIAKNNGVAYFKGAMSTTGTNPVAFTLPAAFRPHKDVYISVDMCDATYGRLFIAAATGIAMVQTSTFSNAQCFTSLDGVFFAL